jgi:hypothetical protein
LLVLKHNFRTNQIFFIYEELSKSGAHEVRNKVEVALKHGMISIPDASGTNIDVQILIQKNQWAKSSFPKAKFEGQEPVLIVMDYALVSKLTKLMSY